jgi:hypothetical protein
MAGGVKVRNPASEPMPAAKASVLKDFMVFRCSRRIADLIHHAKW